MDCPSNNPVTPPETPSTPRGEANEVVREFICTYCGLMPNHVSDDDIQHFINSKGDVHAAIKAVYVLLNTRPAQAALSEEDAVPIIALTLYERDPATSNGLALSWRQCEDIFPERINQVLGDAEAAYRALTSQNRG